MKCCKTTLKTLIMLPIVAVTYFSASTTLAYNNPASVKIANTTNANIYVKSNGDNYTYTGIAKNKHPVGILLYAHVSAHAPEDSRINSWKAGLALQKYGHSYTPNLESHINSQSGVYGESYSHKPKRKRPRYVQRDISLTISTDKLNTFGSQVCNAHADNLRQQGMSNSDIFKQDRSVKIYSLTTAKSVTVSYNELGAHFVQSDDYGVEDINMTCMKAPIQIDTPNALQTSSGVTNSTLNITEQSTLGGSCKVNLSTTITTNLPNTTVKYRYEHVNGKKSDIKTVKTDHSKTAMDAHWYDVPKTPDTGRIRIIGVSHPFKSAWKGYTMNCHEGGPNNVALVPSKPVLKDFSLLPINKVMYNGMLCPTKLRVTARIVSEKAFNGHGNITMKSDHFAFATHDVNLEPHKVWQHAETFNLKPWSTINSPVGNAGGNNTWQTQPSSAATTPSQRFELRYTLTVNNKHVIESPFKTISVQCAAPMVNPHVLPSNNGGITTAPKPTKSKQKSFKFKAVPVQKQQKPAAAKPLKIQKKTLSK